MTTVVQSEPAANVEDGPNLPRRLRNTPPVIIMNLFYSGLGIARDMAKSGVRVIGLSAEPKIYGNHTRCCDVRSAPNSQTEPEALVSYLLSVSEELRGAVIFPTRDADVVLLDRYRAVLSPHFVLGIPPSSCLRQVLDKNELVDVATRAGIPVPRTVLIHSKDELGRVAAKVGFPCVVKPVSSVDWRQGSNWDVVGGRKAFRVDSQEELEREYLQVSAANPSILVQEWIPGATDQIVIMAGYVNAQSDPVAFFTARKLVQSPDDFGTGCIVASEPIPVLHEPTRRLWKALGYRGMAEVEYKYDSRTAEYKLIEINTRHWDQHRLASMSRINLTWIAYCDATGQPLPPFERPTARATWVAEDALLWYVLRAAWRRELRLQALLHNLRGARIYGIASWKDPVPFLRQIARVTRDAAAGVAAKLKGRT